MNKLQKDQNGFTGVELVILLALVAVIGFIGYDIYHHDKINTAKNTTPSLTSNRSSAPVSASLPSGTDNASLQSDLSSINSGNAQSTQDLSASNSGLNDQSTFTSY